MKISVLLEREPFEKIFEKTFSSFLKSFTGHPHTVKWYTKKYKSKNNASIQQWYCNPLINSIFTKGVNPSVFDSIIGAGYKAIIFEGTGLGHIGKSLEKLEKPKDN